MATKASTAARTRSDVAGEVHRVTSGQTVVVLRNATHQISSVGEQPLELLGVFGVAPVEVYLPDGERPDLPWRS